jgi:hypothetical protein
MNCATAFGGTGFLGSSRRALFARGRHQGAHSLAASGARRDDGIEQIAADA